MWRQPFRTCRGQIPNSNVQAIPKNLYRAGLGVGMSPSVKKSPVRGYRPGVGHVQIQCCVPSSSSPPSRAIIDGGSVFTQTFPIVDGGNVIASGPIILQGGFP